MRYLAAFVVALALGVMGCGQGVGGSGGGGGTGGTDLCAGILCEDDRNECTDDLCNPANGTCEPTFAPDGRYCAESKGRCYGGACNFVPATATVGDKEVVFDWTTDRCETSDVPDQPARFVRTAGGELVLFDGNAPTYYVSRGTDFDSLARVCDPPALVSADLRTPQSYENWEWLWSIYREGSNWHALIHNEFHDTVAPTCKAGDPSPGNPCWYNSLTYALSTDGAQTFVKPGAPRHVVAPWPRIWVPPAPGTLPGFDGYYYLEGYLNPSNIILGPEDYYYALTLSVPRGGRQEGGVCAIRTESLGDRASWRAWDGDGFNLVLESPYEAGGDVRACELLPAPKDEAGVVNSLSLTYNTYLERYMAVTEWGDTTDSNDLRCGIYFSLSTDLIHWSEFQEITPARVRCPTDDTTPGQLEPVRVGYASIIDHADSSTNFERPGRTPYLYYTRYNDGGGNRDLVRVPIKFTMGGPLCEGVDCDDQDACTDDTCNGADGSCEHTPTGCAPDFNDCTIDDCDPAIGCQYTPAPDGSACDESNECAVGQCARGVCALTPVTNGTPCTGGTCQAGVCTWYAQDFESLDQMSPTALSDDGWLTYANVLDGSGSLKFSYGDAAPNGTGGFSDIVTGEGGFPQGNQQLLIYSDYNCCDPPNHGHFSGTDLVQQLVYQEPFSRSVPIPASANGKTVVFSFDAKRGDINDPAHPLCAAPNVCDSSANAFVKTLDPASGWVTTGYVAVDTTNLSIDWNRLTILLPLADVEGQNLQFGFGTDASNFEPSGVLYDNIVVALVAEP